MSKLLRFLMPIVNAVVLGPLIAGLAVTLLAVVYSFFDQSGSLVDAIGMSTLYLAFAYVIGGPIALLAGLLVSILMIWRPASFLVVISAAVIATAVWMGVGATGMLGPVEYTNAHSNFLFTLVLAVIAAAGCWLLMKRFARVA